MTRRRSVAAVIVVALAVAGCTTTELPEQAGPTTTSAAPADRSPTTTPPTPTPAPLDWFPCGALECATLTVPLDYDQPTGATIDLAVARRASTSGDPIGALIVNPGGPGASGVAFVRNGGASALRDDFDIVSWDPRGVGDSRALDCAQDTAYLELDPQPDDETERVALDEAARAVAEECGAADPELLPTLTTENAARDVEQLRRALGDEPLNYLGFSYGTHIGLQYAHLFPDHIRAMALDGVVDPRETLTEFLTGQAVAMERLLGPNLDAYRDVARQVEVEPLPTRTGETVGPGLLGVAAFESAYGTRGERQLAAALDDARAGDGTALARLAESYLGSAPFAGYLGVLCVDGPRPVGLVAWQAFIDDISRAAPDLGASIGNELLPCATWPVQPAADADEPTEPVWSPTLPPILLVASTADAATPLDDAQRVHDAVPNSVLLVRDGPGHTSLGASACVRSAVTAYLVDLDPPDEGTTCPS